LAAIDAALKFRHRMKKWIRHLSEAMRVGISVEWRSDVPSTEQLCSVLSEIAQAGITSADLPGVGIDEATLALELRLAHQRYDWTAMRDVVDRASQRHINHHELDAARVKLSVLQGVRDLILTLHTALRNGDAEQVATSVSSLLELRDRIGPIAWSSVAGAEETVQKAEAFLQQIQELCTQLNEAVQSMQTDRIQSVVRRLEGVRSLPADTKRAKDILSSVLVAQQNLSSALASGMQRGWERESIETQPLAEAIEQARQLPANSAEGKVLLQKAEAIYALRIGLKRDDWDGVERAVEAAGQLDVGRSEVQAAREKLTHRAEVVHCLQELQRAIAAVDEGVLRAALQEAYRLCMVPHATGDYGPQPSQILHSTGDVAVIEQALQMLGRLEDHSARLARQIYDVDVAGLTASLNDASALKLSGVQVTLATNLLKTAQVRSKHD
jgi:hypothetical protein